MINDLRILLAGGGETEVLEFKTARQSFDKDKLGRCFSALSNEANLANKSCAWLIFGVNDEHSIVGTQITGQTLNKYKLDIAKNTSPTLGFVDIHRVSIEGKQALMLQIPPALKGVPTAWKGHYYGRDGESLGALNIEELERIKRQKTPFDWSAKTIDNGYCQKMILDFLKKFKSGRRQDFEEMLLDKLPDVLNKQQKRNKVRNNLQSLKKQKLIEPHGKLWKMFKPKN